MHDALHDRYGSRVVPISPDAIFDIGGYSQLGQDLLVNRLFGGVPGVFVDVGAHDGLTLSNSWLLERSGWTGLCIEPNPTVFDRTAKARARVVCAAVGKAPGRSKFRVVDGYGEMLSGLESSQGRRELARIERDLGAHGGSWTTIEVEVRRLDEILRTEGIDRVDYLSIDVEGGEAGVLASVDLAEFDVGLVTIENNYRSRKLRQVMRHQGYLQLFSIGHDDVFIQPKLSRLF